MSTERSYVTEPGYVIAAAMLLSVLDIIAVSLRFLARIRQRDALRIDDWLVLLATILVTAIAIEVTYGVSQGAVAYPTQIPPDFAGDPLELTTPQISLVYKIQWAFDLMLPLALGSVKTSFLFFYLRIFLVNRRSLAGYLLGGLITLVILWSLSFFFASLFQCRLNFWALWGSTSDIVNNCTQTMQLVLAVCITGVITDTAIICAPIPLVWQLKLSTAKKISIVAIFLLGSITIVASLLRLVMMARLVVLGFTPDEDGLLVVTEYLYWGIVECGVGVLAACLPTLQSLFRHWSLAPVMTSIKSFFSTISTPSEYAKFRGTSNMTGHPDHVPLSRDDTQPRSSRSAAGTSARATDIEAYPMEHTRAHDLV